MSNPISARRAAELLGVDKRTVTRLCRVGLIRGAYLVGAGDCKLWVVPVGPDGIPERIKRLPGPKPKGADHA